MANIPNRYPLATADGQAIPLDVVRPNSSVMRSFTTAAGSAALSLPVSTEVMVIYTDKDCIIQFAASAAVAAAYVDGTIKADSFFIPSSTIVVLSPIPEKPSFSLIGIAAAGTAYINFLEKWSGMALQSQFNRR
jgi:hypothetical protein